MEKTIKLHADWSENLSKIKIKMIYKKQNSARKTGKKNTGHDLVVTGGTLLTPPPHS